MFSAELIRQRGPDAVPWRLKGVGVGGKLSRGVVAEWLNAAVSKTVTSVIPASGVRIPPSPQRQVLGPRYCHEVLHLFRLCCASERSLLSSADTKRVSSGYRPRVRHTRDPVRGAARRAW